MLVWLPTRQARRKLKWLETRITFTRVSRFRANSRTSVLLRAHNKKTVFMQRARATKTKALTTTNSCCDRAVEATVRKDAKIWIQTAQERRAFTAQINKSITAAAHRPLRAQWSTLQGSQGTTFLKSSNRRILPAFRRRKTKWTMAPKLLAVVKR